MITTARCVLTPKITQSFTANNYQVLLLEAPPDNCYINSHNTRQRSSSLRVRLDTLGLQFSSVTSNIWMLIMSIKHRLITKLIA
jgi:hypothetical protein